MPKSSQQIQAWWLILLSIIACAYSQTSAAADLCKHTIMGASVLNSPEEVKTIWKKQGLYDHTARWKTKLPSNFNDEQNKNFLVFSSQVSPKRRDLKSGDIVLHASFTPSQNVISSQTLIEIPHTDKQHLRQPVPWKKWPNADKIQSLIDEFCHSSVHAKCTITDRGRFSVRIDIRPPRGTPTPYCTYSFYVSSYSTARNTGKGTAEWLTSGTLDEQVICIMKAGRKW